MTEIKLPEGHKPILVFYTNVGNIPSSEVDEYIKNIIANVKVDFCENLFIPIRPGDGCSRVECVYPKYHDEEGIKMVLDKIEELMKLQK